MRLIDADYLKTWFGEKDLYTYDYIIGTIDDAPTVKPEAKLLAEIKIDKEDLEDLVAEKVEEIKETVSGKWTTEEVAELLSNLLGDECACNYNGIDEWLPERCKYTEIADECPNPKEKHGCWMQFLLQGGADMKGEQE